MMPLLRPAPFINSWTLSSLAFVFAACGPASPKSQISLRLVLPSDRLGTLEDATSSVLNNNSCYFIHVSGPHESLNLFAVPQATCSTSPQKIGLTKGSFKVGESTTLSIVSGSKRRIDLVGVSRADLDISASAECPKMLDFQPNTAKPELSKFRFGGSDISLDKTRLYASATRDLAPGAISIDLPYTNLAAGTPYFCSAAVDAPPVSVAPSDPLIVENLSTVAFGTHTVGGTAPSLTLTLRNTTSEEIQFTGPSYPYSLFWNYKGYTFPGTSGTCATVIAAGTSCVLHIAYDPYTSTANSIGAKNFTVSFTYNHQATAHTLSLPASANVVAGVATSFCILGVGENMTSGCPYVALSSPSFSSIGYEVQATDLGGNVVPFTTNTTLFLSSSEIGSTPQSVPIYTGQSSATGFLSHGRESNVMKTLYLKDGGGSILHSRNLAIDSVCGQAQQNTNFQSGNGSVTEPYTICTPQQFMNIGLTGSTLSENYLLANNLDMSSVYLPVNTSTEPFLGVLDGNGYEIQNARTSGTSSSNLGLFAAINNATLRNLRVVDPTFLGNSYIGALTGLALGTSVIENNTLVFIAGAAKIGNADQSSDVGGLVGKAMGNTLIRNNVVQLGSNNTYDRIAGRLSIGGIVGSAYANSSMEHNIVTGLGRISAINTVGNTIVGGLVGTASSSGTLIRESKVDTGPVIYSYAASGGALVGGVVGNLYGQVRDTSFKGNITINSGNSSDRVGGIVGHALAGSNVSRSIAMAVSISAASSEVGGIAGENASSGVCSGIPNACIYSNIFFYACKVGTSCSSGSFSKSMLVATDFNTYFGSSSLQWNVGKWMIQNSNNQWAGQWESVAGLNPSFVAGSANISNDGLVGTFPASNGIGAFRSNVCKSTGQWYWEVTLDKGDWGEEFGILASTASSPATHLSFNRSSDEAWSIRDIAGSFVPYIGSGLDMTYYPNYSIVPKNGAASTRPEIGDVIGVRLDLDSSPAQLQYFLNGVALAQSGNNSASHTIARSLTGAYCAAVGKGETTSMDTVFNMNFGTKPFKYPANITGSVLPYNYLQ